MWMFKYEIWILSFSCYWPKAMFDRNVSFKLSKTNSKTSWEHLTQRLEALCNASWEDNNPDCLSNALILRNGFWDSAKKINLRDTGGPIWEDRLWCAVFLLFDTSSFQASAHGFTKLECLRHKVISKFQSQLELQLENLYVKSAL